MASMAAGVKSPSVARSPSANTLGNDVTRLHSKNASGQSTANAPPDPENGSTMSTLKPGNQGVMQKITNNNQAGLLAAGRAGQAMGASAIMIHTAPSGQVTLVTTLSSKFGNKM